jgi:uncharacterized membrane protein YbhN (UPF0104 family)
MKWLHNHPLEVTAFAFVLAAVAVAAIATAYGPAAFVRTWSDLNPEWLALTICAGLLAIPAYVLAYVPIARLDGGPKLALPLAVRVVTVGFGPFTLGGGFALDKRALHAIADDEHFATVRVFGLGALEWAVLAPAAWISALLLLVGSRHANASVVWPWTVLVPLGFVAAVWLSHPRRRRVLAEGAGRWRRGASMALHGVGILHSMMSAISHGVRAWSGAVLYWTFEIAAFYGALRFVGLHPKLIVAILAYATGYALTRRSTPLGGAGTTEAFLTFSLYWLGQPIGPALAAVVVYRVFNFLLPAAPALLSHARIKPLLDASYEGRTATHHEHRRASAPFRLRRR